MSELRKIIKENIPSAQEALQKFEEAQSLYKLAMSGWRLVRLVGVHLIVEKIQEQPHLEPGICPTCGGALESKGQRSRSILTILGMVRWHRKVYRCVKRCPIGQICPSDKQLQIQPEQQTCLSVKKVACLLAICIPYQLSSIILGLLTGVKVCPKTMWHWVQEAGQMAMQRLERELEQTSQEEAWRRPLKEELKLHLLAIGGDGVMVPFRPNGGSPKGKTVWKEVKIGLVAWLREHLTSAGKRTLRPIQREVIAVLGNIEAFKSRIWLAALNQGILKAKRAVWLSDGGRGFWGAYSDYIAPYATGVLDFYHAAQHLWKGAKEWFDGRTRKAREWFKTNRRKLRDGKECEVLRELQRASELDGLSESVQATLEKIYNYLDKHREHIDYERFTELGYPLGSGIIESTCKWLIQQRFKGVGMRWSEDGFNHLLHLRLAWVNGTYFDLWKEEDKK